MDNEDEEHPNTSQPCTKEVKKMKCMLREWEDEIKKSKGPSKEGEHLRTVVAVLNTLKTGAYGGGTEKEVNRSIECWTKQ